MVYFSHIDKICKLVSDYENIIVVSGSDTHEINIANKVTSLINSKSISIPSGEDAKDIKVVELLWSMFSKFNIDRSSLIISVGGGSISDSVGFAASTYMRGIDFASVPTTLLAMCDASIGGKRAINTSSGKNIIGSFHDAKFVIIDTDFLSTLSDQDYKSGMCEVLKLGFILGNIIYDEKEMIKEAIKAKQSIVDEDYLDNKDIRISLNYGHTLGHAIEKLYNVKHGLAVALGMDFAAFCNNKLIEEQREVFKKFNIDFKIKIDDVDSIIEFIKHDKKITNGKIKFIVLEKFGEFKIIHMNMEKLKNNLIEYISE